MPPSGPSAPLAPGARVGPFALVRPIGHGGAGAVWEAVQTGALERRVALKVLHAEGLAASDDAGARFFKEVRAAAGLSHPNVVTVYDAGVDGERPWLAMEFLEGETLATRAKRDGRIAPAELTALMLPILSAVAAMHDAGLVHRDLKPANLFLARRGLGPVTPKVLDLGLVKEGASQGRRVTRTNITFGTPRYMSPEQCLSAKDVDARSDQFALATILYECATGHRPFDGPTAHETMRAVIQAAPAPMRLFDPSIPAAFEAAVLRALEKSPDRRFASLRELGAALIAFAPPGVRAAHSWEFGGEPTATITLPPALSPELPATLAPIAAIDDAITRTTTPPLPVRSPAPRAPWVITAAAITVAVIAVARRPPPATREPAPPTLAAPPPPAPVAAPPVRQTLAMETPTAMAPLAEAESRPTPTPAPTHGVRSRSRGRDATATVERGTRGVPIP